MKLAAALLAASIAGAAAQPATESVTVTGARARDEQIKGFVQTFAAPTRMTGKLVRWEEGICPITVGLRPAATNLVTRRIRDIAARAGAPVNSTPSCRPNIEIVFTTTPQALADGVRKNHQVYLGYHDNSAQAEQIAKVTHPIQAWYTTATRDLSGIAKVDSSRTAGVGDPNEMAAKLAMGSVTGSRLSDGLRSVLHHVIIVADPNRLADYEIGTVADYIAMLSLTQLSALDACQQLPSIANLLAAGCERKANALTDDDLAYLNGLYAMSADGNLRMQQDGIAYRMKETLGGK